MSFTAICSALATFGNIVLQLVGLKNAPAQQRAAAAKVDEKVDEKNTEIVKNAIETGNLDDLRK